MGTAVTMCGECVGNFREPVTASNRPIHPFPLTRDSRTRAHHFESGLFECGDRFLPLAAVLGPYRFCVRMCFCFGLVAQRPNHVSTPAVTSFILSFSHALDLNRSLATCHHHGNPRRQSPEKESGGPPTVVIKTNMSYVALRHVLRFVSAHTLANVECVIPRLGQVARAAVVELAASRFGITVEPVSGCAWRMLVQEGLAGVGCAGLAAGKNHGRQSMEVHCNPTNLSNYIWQRRSRSCQMCLHFDFINGRPWLFRVQLQGSVRDLL